MPESLENSLHLYFPLGIHLSADARGSLDLGDLYPPADPDTEGSVNHILRQLTERLNAEMEGIRTLALVTDLSNAVRSGRLNPVLKHIADWLRLTPILTKTRDGKVGVHGFLPGRRNLIDRFAQQVANRIDSSGPWEIAIAYGGGHERDGEALEQALAARIANLQCCWKIEIGAALGVHAGME